LKKGKKDVDVCGKKSGPDLRPAMKPLQCDPRIHYLLPINRVPKDSAPGKIYKVESIKKPPDEQPTSKKCGRLRKGSSLDETSKAKKRKSPPMEKTYIIFTCYLNNLKVISQK